MTFNTSVVTAEYRLMGNSKDCECNLETFECFRESSANGPAREGTSGVVAMARYTLTPVDEIPEPTPSPVPAGPAPPTPVDANTAITQVIYQTGQSSPESGETFSGSIGVIPGQAYSVNFQVL